MKDLLVEDLIFRIEENKREAVFLINTNGLVLSCNRIAAYLFGYCNSGEVVNLSVKQLVPDDFAELFPEEISQEHLTLGNFEPRINRKKSGQLFTSLVKTQFVFAGKIKFIETTVKIDGERNIDQELIKRRRLEQNIDILKCELKKEKNKNFRNRYTFIKESEITDVHIDHQFRNCLSKIHHGLTFNDLRLASMIVVNTNSHEMAKILNISLNSVYVARKRFRKKLGIDQSINLTEYLIRIIE